MKLCVHLLLFIWTSLGLPEISKTQRVCANNGEVRLVGGSVPHEGRVEICINNEWGTVCDDRWTSINSMVVCRQLGYSDQGSASTLSFGGGTGPIHRDEVKCIGNEIRLADCPYISHFCTHIEDIGVQCIPIYPSGEVTLMFNGRIQQNNSLIMLDDTGFRGSPGLVCVTNRIPCCSGLQDGSWFQPDGSQVLLNPVSRRFYQSYSNRQAVILYHSSSTTIGIFRCAIKDSANSTKELYIGIVRNGIGRPVISSMRYESSSRTIVCTSIGGPATNVTWTRNNTTLMVDGSTYQQSQIITNTIYAVYENRLTIGRGNQGGVYTCMVENAIGVAVSSQVRVPACTNGDARFEEGTNTVTELCHNGEWYGVTRQTQMGAQVMPPTNVAVPLGVLLGLSLVVLIAAVAVMAVCTFRAKKKAKDNLRRTPITNDYEDAESVGEHLVRNDIYGNSSLEVTTRVFTEHEDRPNSYTIELEDRNVERIVQNVAYETTEKPADEGYSKLDPAFVTEARKERKSRAEYEIPTSPGGDQDPYSHLEH